MLQVEESSGYYDSVTRTEVTQYFDQNVTGKPTIYLRSRDNLLTWCTADGTVPKITIL